MNKLKLYTLKVTVDELTIDGETKTRAYTRRGIAGMTLSQREGKTIITIFYDTFYPDSSLELDIEGTILMVELISEDDL